MVESINYQFKNLKENIFEGDPEYMSFRDSSIQYSFNLSGYRKYETRIINSSRNTIN